MGYGEWDVSGSVITFVIIVVHADYLIHHIPAFHVFTQRLLVTKQDLRHTGTDHDHLSSVPHVLLIDEAAVMRLYIHVIDRGMIRIYAIGLSRHIFLVVSDRVIVGDSSRAKIHLLEVSLQGA